MLVRGVHACNAVHQSYCTRVHACARAYVHMRGYLIMRVRSTSVSCRCTVCCTSPTRSFMWSTCLQVSRLIVCSLFFLPLRDFWRVVFEDAIWRFFLREAPKQSDFRPRQNLLSLMIHAKFLEAAFGTDIQYFSQYGGEQL